MHYSYKALAGMGEGGGCRGISFKQREMLDREILNLDSTHILYTCARSGRIFENEISMLPPLTANSCLIEWNHTKQAYLLTFLTTQCIHIHIQDPPDNQHKNKLE